MHFGWLHNNLYSIMIHFTQNKYIYIQNIQSICAAICPIVKLKHYIPSHYVRTTQTQLTLQIVCLAATIWFDLIRQSPYTEPKPVCWLWWPHHRGSPLQQHRVNEHNFISGRTSHPSSFDLVLCINLHSPILLLVRI